VLQKSFDNPPYANLLFLKAPSQHHSPCPAPVVSTFDLKLTVTLPLLQNKYREAAAKEAEASPFNAFNLFGGTKDKLPRDVGIIGALFFFGMLVFYVFHCCWVSAEMYSAPSIVLQSRSPQGGVHVFDDFREAYGWLRHNTHEEAKVSS